MRGDGFNGLGLHTLLGILHNYAVFAVQRMFYQQGLPLLVLPIRV